MKKLLNIIICLLFWVSILFAQTISEKPQVTSDQNIEKVLKEFFEFTEKSKSKDTEVEALLKEFRKKLDDKKLNIFTGESKDDIFFEYPVAADGVSININGCLLYSYQKNPSIMYSSLILLAAKNNYNNKNYDSKIEEIGCLLKCCELQAKFVDKYLSKSKMKLTPYEKALLASYRDNNLYDFMFKYYAIDAEWLDYLKEVFSSESTANGKLKQLRDIGEKKIEESKLKLKEGASEEEIYNALVMPAMYCELVPYYVYTLSDGNKSGKAPEEFDWAAVDPKLAETMQKLKETVKPFLAGLKYRDKLRENIGKILVQK
ncbi:MAG: hypothetical protein A2452_06985 [Candidatus Firestonebacteria bacterium RIFOXYC2_FULL_39_67]|nr:MAG: hypothetical protein A2536_00380 [Candidatus Firestonebacteria bacterium RIFOXYD2_FULL_39_29]OGF56451.1 MAG: hypothetical protein A2452_06985 [Candidatus Firestonebacteria bacterium RIFOXYC2_FULL_39_67]OGF56995.1 MAG: hypothetical protein A2497_04450 [Candidatus Firestonebacteria bacterium RifOxyC12_full_39_7]